MKNQLLNVKLSVYLKTFKLETAFMVVLWSNILEHIKKIDKKLQSIDINLVTAVNLYTYLKYYFASMTKIEIPLIFWKKMLNINLEYMTTNIVKVKSGKKEGYCILYYMKTISMIYLIFEKKKKFAY